MYTDTIKRTRGDQVVVPLRLVRPAFDFAGMTVIAQVRETPDGAVLATPALATDTSTLGVALITATIEGSTTQTLPRKVVLEIQVQQSAASFGPFTVLRLTIELDPDYARPS